MDSIVKATGSEEFLVLLPHLLGYTPSNSIVIQTFCSRRTAASLRVDLPPEEGPRHDPVPDALIRLISRVPGVDAVLVVVYSTEQAAEGGTLPRHALVERIVARMASAGLGIVDALWASAAEWISYLDGERGSLAELRDSPMSDRLRPPEPFASSAPPAAQGAPPLTDAPAKEREEVQAAAAGITDDFAERERLWRVDVAIRLWRDTIDSHPDDVPSQAVAALLWSLRNKTVRDCVLMELAWGERGGSRAIGDLRFMEERGVVPEGSILCTLVGEGAAVPSGLRLDCAITLLRHLTARAPEPWRLAPLTLLGWLEWARGRGSAAGDYLADARRIGPGYELARLFSGMMEAGRTPDWVGRAPL